jgi:hypothetical protein
MRSAEKRVVSSKTWQNRAIGESRSALSSVRETAGLTAGQTDCRPEQEGSDDNPNEYSDASR